MSKGLKGITIEIGGNTTKLNTALKGVNKSSKDLQSELKGVNTLLKHDPKNTVLLKQKQDLLTKSIENTKKKLDTLKNAQKQVQAQFDKGEITEEQFRDFQREIVAVEQQLKKLSKEMNNFGSVTAQKLQVAGTKVQAVGQKVEALGRKLSVLSGVAGASLVGASKVAIDFESAWAGVTKTVDGTEEELESIKQGILDLSQKTASSAEDIAQVAENAGQLGVATENVLAFSETMVRLGDSTNLSADEASTAIAKFYNIMGSDINTVDQFGSALVALGNNSATTEADIMNMATRVGASGRQIGLTEQEVLALSATLSSVGLEAEAGGSAISAVMTQIDKDVALGTDELKTWVEVAGMSVSDFKSLWEKDALSAIQKVIGGMGDASAGGENLNVILDELGVSSLRQTDTMKRLSGASDLLTNSVNISNTAWKENSALTTESEKRYETTASKIQQLKNTVTELCVKLGETLLPIVNTIVEKLSQLVNFFTNLDPSIQKIILGIMGFLAIAGPLLITVGKLITSIGMIMTFSPQIVSAIGGIKTAVSGLFTLIAAHPIIAVVMAIIAVVILLYNKCEWFRDGVNRIFGALGKFIGAIVDVIVDFFTGTIPNAWDNFINYCSNFIDSIISFFSTLPSRMWELLVNAIGKVRQWGSSLSTVARNAISSMIKGVVNLLKNLPSLMFQIGKDIINGIKNGIKNSVTSLYTTIKNSLTGLVDKAKKALGINSPSKVFAQVVGRAIPEGVAKGVNDNTNLANEAVGDMTDDLTNQALDLNGATINRKLATTFAVNGNQASSQNASLLGKLDRIYDKLGRLQVVLDSGALVGETIDKIDQALGVKQSLSARGV